MSHRRPSLVGFAVLSALCVACLGPDLPTFGGGGAGGGEAGGGKGGDGGSGGEVLLPCENDRRDGDETGTDCGGSCPLACTPGEGCEADEDCTSARCVDETCTAPCDISDLMLHYSFENGLSDDSGQGHNGLGAQVTSVDGRFGRALAFNGSTSSLLATGAGDIAGARTLCAWIRPESSGGSGQPIFAAGEPGAADFYALQSDIPGGSCAAATDTVFQEHEGSACVDVPDVTIENEVWAFVCFANDGSGGARFAVNDDVTSRSVPVYSYALSTLSIGSTVLDSSSTQASFQGSIDEVTVWSRSLDGDELQTLYGDGLGCAL